MKIYGLNKTTLLDYPEHTAATVFTGGCNFRCPFCHNSSLVELSSGQPQIEEEEFWEFLDRRRGIIEGVCITGGEPTLQPDLPEFLEKIKEKGYLVKLDTNGSMPSVLWSLLEKDVLDYVAMDVKSSRKGYEKAAGVKGLQLAAIEESIAILKSCGIPYEFRTTVVKGIHRPEDFEAIGKWLEGCRAYYLQAYRENENVLCAGFGAFSREEMEEFADRTRKYIDKVALRGVE